MIAWYVHHHGSGHITRAQTIAAELHVPVLGLSTRPEPAHWPGRWVELPDDAGVENPAGADVTAGSTLHWAPRHHRGLRDRMATISRELASSDIRLMVTDVSVEVALLARLHGVPVVVMAQPGDRTDRAHRTGYDLAELIVAPWPSRPARPWPAEWAPKTTWVGGISRFDNRRSCNATHADPGRTVLVMWGTGGIDVGRETLVDAAAATPEWSWLVAGPLPTTRTDRMPANLHDLGWIPDLWPWICRAGVVVTHAGQNAVAEVAAARRPAVIVPQSRPFDEQDATADAIRRAGIAVTSRVWPAPGEWSGILASAAALGGSGWSHWSTGNGARDVATSIESLPGLRAP